MREREKNSNIKKGYGYKGKIGNKVGWEIVD